MRPIILALDAALLARLTTGNGLGADAYFQVIQSWYTSGYRLTNTSKMLTQNVTMRVARGQNHKTTPTLSHTHRLHVTQHKH